ncbi:PmoA family protein [Luteolibacter sp. GHJ8]|uniref:PmoA family protein n=1 Tax=Luteolibacter rhizosphaerae TaxID=2989719 RepID=A0ABT3G3K0_9BACT|nr:PmoA family protein [Luteolibacter rhizosphaerae]MCW1914427.1 PmoA family protein [Luteolibacter rhizosphaerae]
MKPLLPLLLATVAICNAHAAEGLTATKEGSQMIIRSGKREILRYQAEAGELPRKDIKEVFRRGGYIESLFSPAGKRVNDDFPPNHIHHHGIWSPWTKTEFEGRQPDFWNMGDGKGRVDFVSLGDTWAKDGKVGFQAKHRFVDMTAKPEKAALLETWDLSAESDGKRNIIDLVITQTCATDSPLKLPEYHYGGLGFRGNRAWDGAANCKFLTASGITDRLKVNGAREPWCWVGGTVDGSTCGLTILCHPSNFRAPQPIRVHPTEPFFCYAPQQGGAMEIEPGKPYIARYRIIVTDGEADPAAAAKWAEDYAAIK